MRKPTSRRSPDGLADEQVVLLADVASTGFGGAESGGGRLGDSVVVFAQGPIGLCATAGAKLMGATLIIGVNHDSLPVAQRERQRSSAASAGAQSVSRSHRAATGVRRGTAVAWLLRR